MPTIPEAAETTTSGSHNHGNDAEGNDNSYYLCASPTRYKAKASTLPPPEHSAPGAKRIPCALPDLWKTDPRLSPHKDVLMDVMSRVHDWCDLFEMVNVYIIHQYIYKARNVLPLSLPLLIPINPQHTPTYTYIINSIPQKCSASATK